ncbi:bifunctional riboflavin kinase/FAD synthetase [Lacinutrix sp. Bg11-31]|uniref:bifunctional riboflavin kinase/FAD synthetase n=1 Tax=Lacinutrix sp. Bg11-31 TaxID=2057808 RepID=UPI000C313FF9|nr:bifunctional riboflavin kinase/FAD synthetase [Lacinutrix sp. Bg11-31]AUC82682.1 riboflavin biosynthesis protein RibF [Lacinutrix sp. Bg11-31]
MKPDLIEKRNTVVTIGTFDGVHIGHQKIIERLIEVGELKDLTPTILTFFPHPRMVLQKDADIKLLNTLNEKEQILKQFGLENLVVKKFTKAFSRLTAEEFVETILVKQLNVKHVIIGYDHHFGRNRTANIDDLRAFGKHYNFEVEEITAQDINDVAVSSTKIRTALTEGDIQTANSFLGYPFIISGNVVRGKGLGRTIDFPTANIKISENYKLIPKQGVYVVKSIIDKETVFGMMNIGTNPTVNGKTETIEVHFFNFKKKIYNKTLTIELLERLRDEEKFESIDTLKQQLLKDKTNALQFISNHAQ